VFTIVTDILLFPVKALFLPFKALSVFHNTGVEVKARDKQDRLMVQKGRTKRRWRRIQRQLGKIGKATVLLPIRLLQAPFKFIRSLHERGWK